jgi:hypothetical protein
MQARGEREGLAALVREALGHVQHAMGIDDDFMHAWPPLVRTALWLEDVALAESLLEPVTNASRGLVSEAVGAHHLNLRGLVAAARCDDPTAAELDLRAAVGAFEEFGSRTWTAQAMEDLGKWLHGEGREDDAGEALRAALAEYEAIGASGAAQRLRAWVGEPGAVRPV